MQKKELKPLLTKDHLNGKKNKVISNMISKIATEYDDLYISKILQRTKNIAMVGLSDNWNRPSYFVAKYLLDRGYKIYAINPQKAGDKILGIDVYSSFESIKDKIDMVDIFRNSEAALSITQAALKIKPQTIWMQIGVKNDKAAAIAKKNGIDIIMNRCPKIEFCRLSGELGWAGINSGLFWNNRRIIRPIYKR